jgi:hypothetical protein
MSTKRICYTAKFKFSIALETIKSDKIQPISKRPPIAPQPNQSMEETVA